MRAGKIRYWGLSNFTGWQLAKAVHLARALNATGPGMVQPQYSLLARETEWEIVPAALDAGLGVLPWSPLGGGWLSGKYRRDQRPSGATRLGENPARGMEAYERRGTDRTWHVIDAVQKVAEDRGVPMAEVAIAWVTARPGVSSTILGTRTTSQLEANLRASGLRLTPAETAALDAASDPHPADYPYGDSAWTRRPHPAAQPLRKRGDPPIVRGRAEPSLVATAATLTGTTRSVCPGGDRFPARLARAVARDVALAGGYNRQALAQLGEDEWLLRSFVRWNGAAADWLGGKLGPAERGLAEVLAELRTARSDPPRRRRAYGGLPCGRRRRRVLRWLSRHARLLRPEPGAARPGQPGCGFGDLPASAGDCR